MAASLERWTYEELCKLGIKGDASEEIAKYVLSTTKADELEEYMQSLLDGSNPAVAIFISTLMERWHALSDKSMPGEMVYKKSEQPQVYVQPKGKKKRDRNKNKENGNGGSRAQSASSASSTSASASGDGVAGYQGITSSVSHAANGPSSKQDHSPIASGELIGGQPVGQGAKKKSKFVPLYSQQGKEKLVIKLPGRTQCECQALKHKLVSNCTCCGRVVCEQEGAGPCLFCGRLVCTPEDQEVLARGSKKSEKLRQHLMRDADKFTPLGKQDRERELLPSVSARMEDGLQKAQKHKDRLIDYDRTSVRRTQVIDDECDYFSTDSNRWLSKEDREALRKREQELRAARFASRKDRKITLDFAGRQVLEESNTVGQTMYDHQDAVVQRVQYGQADKSRQRDKPATEEESGFLVNPLIVQPAPQFVSDPQMASAWAKSNKPSSKAEGTRDKSKMSVIQDKELKEMTDEGMCLSMHQPWASLLVAGIKIHEGRTWYTSHRGRLWIAATAQPPSSEAISEMENHYRFQYDDHHIQFPSDYPTSCLLGCVDLVDCLSQEDYRQQFPDGESSSPYVFICETPQDLVIKFPIKGKHKIYKLDSAIHQAAKKGLR